MTRQEYIEAVKVKLEEISPFDEPDAFIDGDPSSTVKPIKEYIEESLDEAAKNCLMTLPLTLLHADVEASTTPALTIDTDGVGKFAISTNRRFIRFRHTDLQRDITAFITSEDPQYLVMQNPHCRPGQEKPVAVVSSDVTSGVGQMEIYTLKPSGATNYTLLSIDLTKKPNSDATGAKVLSPIDDLIVLECARMVLNILKGYDGAKVCENEQAAKIQAILK